MEAFRAVAFLLSRVTHLCFLPCYSSVVFQSSFSFRYFIVRIWSKFQSRNFGQSNYNRGISDIWTVYPSASSFKRFASCTVRKFALTFDVTEWHATVFLIDVTFLVLNYSLIHPLWHDLHSHSKHLASCTWSHPPCRTATAALLSIVSRSQQWPMLMWTLSPVCTFAANLR